MSLIGEGLEDVVGVGEEAGEGLAKAVGLKKTGEEETPEEKRNAPRIKRELAEAEARQSKATNKAKPNAYIVGASWYGGPGDPSSGHIGSSGKDLTGTVSFAELDMGHALGDLPYGTKLRITFRQSGEGTPSTVIAEKLDIGAGGAPVTGKNDGKTLTKARRVDLWYQTAEKLGFKQYGTGLIQIERVDGKPIPGLGKAEQPYNVHSSEYGTGNTTESEQPEPGKKLGAVGFLGELSLAKIFKLIIALGLAAFGLVWLSKNLNPLPAGV